MDAHQVFQVVDEVCLPACTRCHVCVWPNKVRVHLQGDNHQIPRRDAQQVQHEVQQWPNLLSHGHEIPTINHGQALIVQLGPPQHGLKCCVTPSQCNYIGKSDKNMKKHCAIEHTGIRGPSGRPCRARREKGLITPWTAVYCQQLFAHGPGSRFFEVVIPEEESASRPINPAPADKVEQTWRVLEERMATIEDRERRTIEEGEHHAPNPWLTQTKWTKYLRKLDRDELVQSVTTPNVADEPVAHAIWESMATMMAQCQSTVGEHVGLFVRKEVMRSESKQERFTPIKPYQDAREIKDKGRHWQQLVMFFVRTQQPHTWKSPRYRMNRRQQQAFRRMMHVAQDPAASSTSSITGPDDRVVPPDADGVTESRSESDDSDDMAVPAVVQLTGLPRACLRFCMALLCSKAQQDEYEHMMVCGLAVLGVDERVGWHGYDTYPPILSAIIKISRFMMIQHAIHQCPNRYDPNQWYGGGQRRPGGNIDGEARDDRDHADPVDVDSSDDHESDHRPPFSDEEASPGCIDIVQDMVSRYMLRTSHGPMAWMMDLRTYGMSVMFNSTGRGYVDWHGDQILYKDIQFTMPEFRAMVQEVVAEARERMLRRVLCVGPGEEGEMPAIPWDDLRDDASNQEPGWDFIHDQRNPWPVDGKRWLFERIMRQGEYQFARDGPDVRWDVDEVRRWLDEEDAVRELLLVAKHLTGGQPARAPEALSVCPSNTSSGAYRNMGIENGRLFEVLRYHKGFNATSVAKIIHRYFPREVEEVLVWWMWMVRPVRERIENEVFDRDRRSPFMWPSYSPAGHTFSPDRMREALKRVSMVHMGTSINIQSYRHIAIAISRR